MSSRRLSFSFSSLLVCAVSLYRRSVHSSTLSLLFSFFFWCTESSRCWQGGSESEQQEPQDSPWQPEEAGSGLVTSVSERERGRVCVCVRCPTVIYCRLHRCVRLCSNLALLLLVVTNMWPISDFLRQSEQHTSHMFESDPGHLNVRSQIVTLIRCLLKLSPSKLSRFSSSFTSSKWHWRHIQNKQLDKTTIFNDAKNNDCYFHTSFFSLEPDSECV